MLELSFIVKICLMIKLIGVVEFIKNRESDDLYLNRFNLILENALFKLKSEMQLPRNKSIGSLIKQGRLVDLNRRCRASM